MEATVVVVTYNSRWDKIRLTLNSILIQKNILFELIIADDGSADNHKQAVTEYLKGRGIKYIFIGNEKNAGTVYNVNSAIKYASGAYVKIISPGDCLNGELCLRKWVDFMKDHDSDISFSKAIYYRNGQRGREAVKSRMSPGNIWIYKKEKIDYNCLFVDYLLANDSISGAALMMGADVMRMYLNEIAGRVKYAEDYMLRLCVFDRKQIDFLDEDMIWYEYGDGISTSKNSRWACLLHDDYDSVNRIIKERKNTSGVNLKYQKFLNLKTEDKILKIIVKVVLFPSTICFRLGMKINSQRTSSGNQDYMSGLDMNL